MAKKLNLNQLIERFEAVTISSLMQELFKDKVLMQYLISLNIHEQLYDQGVLSTGAPIKPRYAKETIAIKEEKGQITDHVTLNDTGAFYESFKIFLDSNSDFEINANTIKDGTDLLAKYGKDVLGLTPESLDKFRDAVRERIPEVFRKVIGLAA